MTEVDTVSISGSPTITNVFYSPSGAGRGAFPLINTNYTITNPGDIILYGKRFNYTRNVYVSANTPALYGSLTAVNFKYFPSLTAAPLPLSSYRVITDNIMEITLPNITNNGSFNIVVDTIVGWDTSYSAMSGYFIT